MFQCFVFVFGVYYYMARVWSIGRVAIYTRAWVFRCRGFFSNLGGSGCWAGVFACGADIRGCARVCVDAMWLCVSERSLG